MISRSTSTVNQDGNTLDSVQGNIEFRNVYFSYLSRPEIPILSGFYLTVPARKTVALVGRNGSIHLFTINSSKSKSFPPLYANDITILTNKQSSN